MAVVKQKPRRKALNYKAQIVTKDLFIERDIEKKLQKEQQKKKIKERNEEKKQKQLVLNKNKRINEEKRQEKQKSSRKSKKKEQTIQTKKSRAKTIKSKEKENNSAVSDDKWYCYACNTESFEDMRQCPDCQRWFHEQCLGLTKEDLDFECPMCG